VKTNAESDADNQVLLRGVLAAQPEVRTMPSGDELYAFRVTVPRPPGERVKVDSIDCATRNVVARRRIEKCQPGDRLEVRGRLHRLFWRGPAGLASRYEVYVLSVTVGRRSAASRGRKAASE